jgi:hypothetical protein
MLKVYMVWKSFFRLDSDNWEEQYFIKNKYINDIIILLCSNKK